MRNEESADEFIDHQVSSFEHRALGIEHRALSIKLKHKPDLTDPIFVFPHLHSMIMGDG